MLLSLYCTSFVRSTLSLYKSLYNTNLCNTKNLVSQFLWYTNSITLLNVVSTVNNSFK